MKMPSTANFSLNTIALPTGWDSVHGTERISTIERWAIEHLGPREAIISCGMAQSILQDGEGYPMTIWVLRHNDYDNGDPNIEVHIRVIDPVMRSTEIYNSKDDVLVTGSVDSYVQDQKYLRAKGTNGPLWTLAESSHIEIADPINLPALNRVPLLYAQCQGLANKRSVWLVRNINLLRDGADLTDQQSEALGRLLNIPLFWLASHLEEFDELQSLVDVDFTDRIQSDMQRWRKQLKRANRICLPEHYALHDYIVNGAEWLERYRGESMTRLIGLPQLLQIQKRWINELAPYLAHFHN